MNEPARKFLTELSPTERIILLSSFCLKLIFLLGNTRPGFSKVTVEMAEKAYAGDLSLVSTTMLEVLDRIIDRNPGINFENMLKILATEPVITD